MYQYLRRNQSHVALLKLYLVSELSSKKIRRNVLGGSVYSKRCSKPRLKDPISRGFRESFGYCISIDYEVSLCSTSFNISCVEWWSLLLLSISNTIIFRRLKWCSNQIADFHMLPIDASKTVIGSSLSIIIRTEIRVKYMYKRRNLIKNDVIKSNLKIDWCL